MVDVSSPATSRRH